MSQTPTPSDWRELFRQAVRGWNSDARIVRVQRAFEAVHGRLREEPDSASFAHSERGELNDAAYFLGLLSMAGHMENGGSLRAQRTGTDGR